MDQDDSTIDLTSSDTTIDGIPSKLQHHNNIGLVCRTDTDSPSLSYHHYPGISSHYDPCMVLPPEPDIDSPYSVTLCIKLPNCDRIQRRFNYDDQIKAVISFAQSFLQEDNTLFCQDKACLKDNNVPMNVYSNHSLTLSEVGLTHNTVLHYSYR